MEEERKGEKMGNHESVGNKSAINDRGIRMGSSIRGTKAS